MDLQFNLPDGARMLELGCGETPHSQSTVRVDTRTIPGVTHFTASLEEPLPIRSEDFEICYSRFSYEHCSYVKIPQLLSETCRVLKPGGRAVVIVPNTEAQMRKILAKPEWDGDESCMLFGQQNYEANSHKTAWNPQTAVRWFQQAGFVDINVQPFSLIPNQPPEEMTDMLIVACKPLAAPKQLEPLPVPSACQPSAERAKLFGRAYFDRPYKGLPFYWDCPTNEIVVSKILARKPASVLELGCGRGYVVKRLADAGIPVHGIDISRHCWLTRAHDFQLADACEATVPDADLAFSSDFWNWIPEGLIEQTVAEMAQRAARGLHGIGQDGCTQKPLAWWRERLPTGHEICTREELDAGSLPAVDESELKLNVGCAWTMARGWTNLDVIDATQFAQQFGYKFVKHDVRQGLGQFGTQTVSLINASHFFEHLSASDGIKFLRECRRLLKPDGALRITVPDANKLLGTFWLASGGGIGLEDYDNVNAGCEQAKTQAGKLWALLLEGHAAVYDSETLLAALEETGFKGTVCGFREAASEAGKRILRDHNEQHTEISLRAEAVPCAGG